MLEQQRLNKALKMAIASSKVEGIELKPESEALVREKLSGKISDEEFLKRAKEAARNV